MSDTHPTAVVTGASRGFGRAITTDLVAAGHDVIGIARGEQDLRAVHAELGDAFTPLAADATDEVVAHEVLRDRRPSLLVLNAGSAPHMAPIHEQTWETFSGNWHGDTRHVFTWIRAALREPLAPGSAVIAMSSGAALAGSPLSGGYASAKAAVRYLRGYAAEKRGGRGWTSGSSRCCPSSHRRAASARSGSRATPRARASTADTFVDGLQPILTAEQVAKAVLELASDPAPAAEYQLSGAGLRPLG